MIFIREYGHFLQSASMGGMYLVKGAGNIWDAMSSNNDYYYPFELDANRRAVTIFNLDMSMKNFISELNDDPLQPPSK